MHPPPRAALSYLLTLLLETLDIIALRKLTLSVLLVSRLTLGSGETILLRSGVLVIVPTIRLVSLRILLRLLAIRTRGPPGTWSQWMARVRTSLISLLPNRFGSTSYP